MQSDAVKLAKLQNEREIRQQVLGLITHPVYSVLVSFIVIEALQKVKVKTALLGTEPLMGENAGTMLEGGLVATGVIAALGKSGVLDDLVKGLPALLPLIAR